MCCGLNHTTELTLSVNNLDNRGSGNRAIGIGFKKIVPFSLFALESRLIAGGNFLLNPHTLSPGVWAYGGLACRLPGLRTRITGGLTYGQSQVFGFRETNEMGVLNSLPNKGIFMMAAIEQPLSKHISIIADWYSGNHDLGMLIPAIQIEWKNHTFISGYKFPNSRDNYQAVILEYMVAIR